MSQILISASVVHRNQEQTRLDYEIRERLTPLTPIEFRMCVLFGRASARTGDLTRAQVELVWSEIWQRRAALGVTQTVKPVKPVSEPVRRQGSKRERSRTSTPDGRRQPQRGAVAATGARAKAVSRDASRA